MSVLGAVALVGAGLAALLGSGSPARSLPLRDGAAWVQSLASGSLEKLDTGSGLVGYRLTTPLASKPLDIVDDGTTTVLRDPSDGSIRTIDLSGAKAKLTAPTELPKDAQLAAGAGRTFVLYADGGEVAAIDPATLAVGPPVKVGGDLGTAAVDGAGTLWVAVRDLGAVVPVSAEGGRVALGDRAPVGAPGTEVDVTVSSGAAYGIDRTDGKVLRLRPGGVTPVGQVPAAVKVAGPQGDPADGDLVVGDPSGAVLRVDPRTSVVTRFELPDRASHDLGPPVQSRNRIAVPDRSTGELIVIDPTTGTSEASVVRRGAGNIPVSAVDGAVVANDPQSPSAIVVTPAGASERVDKGGQAPGNDEPAPAVQPVAAQDPVSALQPGSAGVTPAPAVTPAGTPAATSATPVPPPATPSVPPAPVAPGDPVNLRSAGGTGQVVLSWQTSSTGGPPAGFVLTAADGSTVTAKPSESTKAIPAANGKSATFTIRAENTAGRSKDVAFPPAVPQSQVPGAPTGVTAVPGNRQITVSWGPAAANGTTITGYRVLARDGTTVDVPGPSTATATLSSLTNGADYAPLSVTALATTSGGAPVVSAAAQLATSTVPFGKPLAPTGIKAEPGNAQVTVTFPAANGNGSPITGYDVTLNPGGLVRPISPSGTMQYVFKGLTNGTAYTATATATNRAGTGPQSKPDRATPFDKPTVRLGAKDSTESSISLDFSVDDNGSPVDKCWFRLNKGADRSTSCTKAISADNLTSDKDYAVDVWAHNSGGDGPERSVTIHTKSKKYYETVYSNPSPTKTWQSTNASGQGPNINQNTKVEVTCRKHDATVTSNKGGWWYKVAESPWTGYWAPAGDFFNGSAAALWDPDVPVC